MHVLVHSLANQRQIRLEDAINVHVGEYTAAAGEGGWVSPVSSVCLTLSVYQ